MTTPMQAVASCIHQVEVPTDLSAADVCREQRRAGRPVVLFERGAGFREGWALASLVGLSSEVASVVRFADERRSGEALTALGERIRQRRSRGGTAETGVLLMLSYEAVSPDRTDHDAGLPHLVALTVDRSLRYRDAGPALLTCRSRGPALQASRECDRLRREFDALADVRCDGRPADGGRYRGRPVTSLPRDAYLRAVGKIKWHIEAGDIYQANLCQRFEVRFEGDPYEAYRALVARCPAPHAAFVEVGHFALGSVSPETFLRGVADEIETVPIKGTRARGETPEADRSAADELRSSAKDRAELLMIVDLERNDLGRVCRVGSVAVDELAGLRSFPTMHHLVARVRGRLRCGVELRELLAATFPGGSITGAPKIRAMQVLRELEPVARGPFTGGLFWLGDDGSLDSSILIRSLVISGDRCYVGAGGGVVADSDPEQEWHESNHKARALTRVLGFDPEEAG